MEMGKSVKKQNKKTFPISFIGMEISFYQFEK
jgi:hypothetical protein